jgi:hypothetical protein
MVPVSSPLAPVGVIAGAGVAEPLVGVSAGGGAVQAVRNSRSTHARAVVVKREVGTLISFQ